MVTVFIAGRENVSYYLKCGAWSLRQRKELAYTKAEGDHPLPPSALSLVASAGLVLSPSLQFQTIVAETKITWQIDIEGKPMEPMENKILLM